MSLMNLVIELDLIEVESLVKKVISDKDCY